MTNFESLEELINSKNKKEALTLLKNAPIGMRAAGLALLGEPLDEIKELVKNNPEEYLKSLKPYFHKSIEKEVLMASPGLLIAMVQTNWMSGDYLQVIAKQIYKKPETGTPIYLLFHKNLEKSPQMGDQFGQHIEPTGEYMSFHEPGSLRDLPSYEYGVIHFKNPLVLPWESKEDPMDGSNKSWGWKSYLINQYGVSGRKLSETLLEGYDGLITMGTFGTDSIGEIVNLSGQKWIPR